METRSLVEKIEQLQSENQELRARYREIHRRAQASEGAVLRLERLNNEVGSMLEWRYKEGELKYKMYYDLYQKAVKQIVDLGVDDRVDGEDLHRTGHLSELITRLHNRMYR